MAIRHTGKPMPLFTPPPPPDGGGAGVTVTDIVSRVPGFGRSFRSDKMPRHQNPVEAQRHEDLRVDIASLQEAIDSINALGMPAAPSFLLAMDAATADGDAGGGAYYKKLRHDLGFAPNRFLVLAQANFPGITSNDQIQGYPIPYRLAGSDPLWTDTEVAFRYFAEGGYRNTVRILLFRG